MEMKYYTEKVTPSKDFISKIDELRRKKVFLVLPALPFSLLLLISFFWGKHQVFPLIDKEISPFITYSDIDRGGLSTITPPHYKDSTIDFTFNLQKKYQYPYVGITCDLIEDSVLLNLSYHDYIELEIEADSAHTLQIFLKSFVDNFTDLSKNQTHLSLLKEFSIKNGMSTYRIPLKEFTVPLWWYQDNQVDESVIGKANLSKMISLHIQNGYSTPYGQPIKVIIKKIAFKVDFLYYIYILCAFILLYYLLYSGFLFIVKKASAQNNTDEMNKELEKPVVIPYSKLDVKNESDEDMERIVDAIATHYSDPAFSVNILAKEAGVSVSKVPALLKQKFNMNFKQYLNTIRITESKRLLEETDNQIETVAYNVGYNNIPHFNRTFKQFVGMSPKEYRKDIREKLGDSETEQ